MNTKAIMMAVFLLVGLVGINSLGRFYLEPLVPGHEFNAYFVVRNPSSVDFENVNVRMYMPDLDVLLRSQQFDLNEGQHDVARISWIVPANIRSGNYIARVSAGNDHYSDVEYIYVTVY
ncbi:MAG TPA: hypothetical protein VJH97_02235 [Candidatus Nanoarchaeia archaeon]|nr:hypothetical protein [Candidatus Nanoarchaeia archaeon]